MIKILEGQVKSKGKRYGIVISRFNDFITKRLLDGCLKELRQCGAKDSEIIVIWVPGAFEIPLAARRLNEKKSIDAVICLGAVIRGETLHFDLIARAASEGVAHVAFLTKKPVVFGVLTTETLEQAYKRSEEKGDNKGRDAARTAIEMVNLLRKF